MSLFFSRGAGATDALNERTRSDRSGFSRRISPSKAMTHSGVWACTRLRADLVSELPIDTYRKIGDRRLGVPPPPVLEKPGALLLGGEPVDIHEWMYATQVDVDRVGNTFGHIVARDGADRPARIDLIEAGAVTVVVKEGKVTYRVNGKTYQPRDIWHERQFSVAGLPVGLSPLAHAAMSIGQYLSAQEFASSWFEGGGKPAAHFRNKAKTLTPGQAATIKARMEETTRAGQLLVTGNDWEYEMIAVEAHQAQFIEAQRFSLADGARFLGVPADLIDAAESGSNITYANITQRNLQLLVLNMQPAISRRERALSRLMVPPRYARLNTKALLRMDPKTQQEVVASQIDHWQMTPDEARALDDAEPLTEEQIAQLARLTQKGGAPKPQEAAS